MGLYNNRIVVKVGTSTLTNDAGKSDLRTTDRLAVYFLISRTWDMKLYSFPPERSQSEEIN